jgi:hypothetical protein
MLENGTHILPEVTAIVPRGGASSYTTRTRTAIARSTYGRGGEEQDREGRRKLLAEGERR